MSNQSVGARGEDAACQYLKGHGYLIVKRNVKLSYYELDIIAEHERKLIFIEVKAKNSNNDLWQAENLMDKQKYKNFKRAAQIYCGKNKISLNRIRLDLIAVNFNSDYSANIKHYLDVI